MFGLPAWSHVEIGFIPQNSWGLHGIVLIVSGKFLQGVEGFLIDQEALFDPAFDSAGGAYADETLLALQHLDALSILHVADAIEDGRHLVAQRGLRRRDICHLEHPMTPATTPGSQKHRRHR